MKYYFCGRKLSEQYIGRHLPKETTQYLSRRSDKSISLFLMEENQMKIKDRIDPDRKYFSVQKCGEVRNTFTYKQHMSACGKQHNRIKLDVCMKYPQLHAGLIFTHFCTELSFQHGSFHDVKCYFEFIQYKPNHYRCWISATIIFFYSAIKSVGEEGIYLLRKSEDGTTVSIPSPRNFT